MCKKAITIILALTMVLCSLSFSVNAKAVKVPSPKLKSVTATDTTTLKIKWSKVSGVKGYVLYCKKSGGSFKKLKTFGKSTTSYTHKNLTTGKKYFYKVRAYKTVSGNTKYSGYSNTVSKKCTNLLVNIYSPYSSCQYNVLKDGASVTMGGDKYYNGFTLYAVDYSYALFNLKGKYRYISFTYGFSDEYGNDFDNEFSILSDDYCVKSITAYARSLPKTVKINIENANKLEIKNISHIGGGCTLALTNIKLYK